MGSKATKSQTDIQKALFRSASVTEIAQLVEDNNIDINIESDAINRTLLAKAAEDGRLEIVQWLVEHGADVNLGDSKYCLRPLFLAATEGHKKIVQYLLEHGADPEARDFRGETALMRAASYKKDAVAAEMVSLLLGAGANVNSTATTGYVGMTPLMWAANSGNAKTVEVLLRAGADRTAKDQDGWDAVRHATEGAKRPDIAQLITPGGQNMSTKTFRCSTCKTALEEMGMPQLFTYSEFPVEEYRLAANIDPFLLRGLICDKCKKVYCPSCAGMQRNCPTCNATLMPAHRGLLTYLALG